MSYHIGTVGPFFDDDEEAVPSYRATSIETDSLVLGTSTINRRLVMDDESKAFTEVSALTEFIDDDGVGPVLVTDNGDGTVTLSFSEADAVADVAAMTAAAVDPATVTLADLATQYNALRTDVAAIHTTLNALLASLRTENIIVT